MNNKLIEKLNELISKHQVIAEQLKDEMIYQDHALLKKLNQEFSKIDPIIKKYDEYKNAIKLIEESQAFLNEKDKPFMSHFFSSIKKNINFLNFNESVLSLNIEHPIV